MGRGSKIKHIEKNNFSKFKQVLVKKEDKEKSGNKGPGTSKKPDTSKEPDRPQTSECVDRTVEHEMPEKTDGLEKSEATTEPQVKSQEISETSKMVETRKGQGPDNPPKSESPDTTVEDERSKKPDKHEKSQKAEGLQVQRLKKLDLMGYESPKKRGRKSEKSDTSQKSESTLLKPDGNDSSKTPDKLISPQWPKGPQIKGQEKPETSKEPDRSNTSECVDRTVEHEIPQKTDRLEKYETIAEPQVKSQEISETSKMVETRKGQGPDRPPKYESPDTTVEDERSKKPDKHEKSQKAEGLQVQRLKKLDLMGYESPKKRGRKSEKSDTSQKSESTLLKPDGNDSSKTPDKLISPQWPKGPQIKGQEKPETSKEPDRSNTSECVDRTVEHEIPQKTDRLEKYETITEPQVKSQEISETSKMVETHKGQGPDRPPKYESPDTTVEDEMSKKPDKHEKSQKAEGLQVQRLKKLDLMGYESPKRRGRKSEKSDTSQKSESTLLKPDGHDSSKMPDKYTLPQWPKGPQIRNQEKPETPKESEKPQTVECVDRPVEHEIPQKAHRQEKSETPRPQNYVSPDTTVENEKSQKPDKHDKPERVEGLVQSLKKPDTSKRYESPKRQEEKSEKPEISQKSENALKPDEHNRSKMLDKFITPQWPKRPQIKSRERSETLKEQKGKQKRPERPPNSESPDIRDNLECPKKSDRIDKAKYPEKPQVKNQEKFEMHKGKTESLERPQISERTHNIPIDHKRPWKSGTFDKHQRPVGSQVNNQEGLRTSKRSEMSNGQKGEAERHMKKSDSPNIPDKQELSKKPDRLDGPQKPEGPQKAKSPDSSQKAEKPEKQEKSESSVKLDVQTSVKLKKVPEEEIKHPLEYTWGMWLITNDKRNWEDNLVKLTSFSTVEDYWCLYHYMKPPSELDRGKDYAVFKNEFRPMWEDPANRNGGRWLINFDKKRNEISDLDSIWMFVVLLVIGENFRVSDAICGAVVSVRTKSRIAVWVSSYKNENAVKDVGHTLRNTLGLRGRLSFQQHNTNTSLLTL